MAQTGKHGISEVASGGESVILPEPTLRRLPWYLAYLSTLKARKVSHVSSTQIARELNVDASQIAKDLYFLNLRGKTRIGYEVAALERKLRDFLGFDLRHNAVVAGVGSLGGALMSDQGLQRYGLNVVAGVDINPELQGSTVCGIPVVSPEELPTLVKKLGVSVGILTVPFDAAQDVADELVAAGVRGLWNFTPRRIRVCSDNTVVANTSIYSHLALMYNRLATMAHSQAD
ncbi:MAG: redox-sensing transcriptional repressor Rex [Muribaculaceae bacterium]|nr:redox-sensing transcriptional repressor Rex [Muribaculaceae bacterium]